MPTCFLSYFLSSQSAPLSPVSAFGCVGEIAYSKSVRWPSIFFRLFVRECQSYIPDGIIC